MTDHAGPQHCECYPETNFWHPPVEVTQFWPLFFVRPKKIILAKRQGNYMKHMLLETVQVTVLFHTDEFMFVWSFKIGNGCQNCSSVAKTGLLRWAGAKT